jgi:hypothetical protein
MTRESSHDSRRLSTAQIWNFAPFSTQDRIRTNCETGPISSARTGHAAARNSFYVTRLQSGAAGAIAPLTEAEKSRSGSLPYDRFAANGTPNFAGSARNRRTPLGVLPRCAGRVASGPPWRGNRPPGYRTGGAWCCGVGGSSGGAARGSAQLASIQRLSALRVAPGTDARRTLSALQQSAGDAS